MVNLGQVVCSRSRSTELLIILATHCVMLPLIQYIVNLLIAGAFLLQKLCLLVRIKKNEYSFFLGHDGQMLIYAKKCVRNHKFPALSLCKMPNNGSMQMSYCSARFCNAMPYLLMARVERLEASPMVNWSQFTIHKVQSSAVLPCFYCRGK